MSTPGIRSDRRSAHPRPLTIALAVAAIVMVASGIATVVAAVPTAVAGAYYVASIAVAVLALCRAGIDRARW